MNRFRIGGATLFLAIIVFAFFATAGDDALDALKERLYHHAVYYALICYRPDQSMDRGASVQERKLYFQELSGRISKANTLPLLLTYAEQFSDDNLLTCAKRNFLYLSEKDRKWFSHVDAQGVESDTMPEAIKRLGLFSTFEQSDLIMVGNEHHVAQIDGEILFSLTDYLSAGSGAVSGILVEHEPLDKELYDAFEKFRSVSCDDEPHFLKLFQDSMLSVIEKRCGSHDRDKRSWLDYPRFLMECQYLSTYPDKRVVGIDLGSKRRRDSAAMFQGIDMHHLQSVFDRSTAKEDKWLLFYGEKHVLRGMDHNDSAFIDKMIRRDGKAIQKFVISQLGGKENIGVRRGTKLVVGKSALVLNGIVRKFGFPYPADEPSEFFGYWPQLIEKYNALHKVHRHPIYVTGLDHADLVVVHPSLISGEKFEFETDLSYLYLKDYLEKD